MSRVQLALNVAHIDEAIVFYSKLFGVEPVKVRPGYANFAIADPPLKLVLIEDPDQEPGTLNHLGVEVAEADAVAEAQSRLAAAGLATASEEQTACCYAIQDKVWVDGPGGEPWEFYTVLADTDAPAGGLRAAAPGESTCCAQRPAATEVEGEALAGVVGPLIESPCWSRSSTSPCGPAAASTGPGLRPSQPA